MRLFKKMSGLMFGIVALFALFVLTLVGAPQTAAETAAITTTPSVTPTPSSTPEGGEMPPGYLPVILSAPDLPPPPSPSPTPSPTATSAAPMSYNDEFTDDIDGWEMRRSRNGTSFELSHGSGTLDLNVNTTQAYALVSPLQISPPFPYRHEIRARFSSPSDGNQLGLAFAGDWDGVSPCPQDCFDEYYEFLVRYRAGQNGGDPYLEYRIRRIEDHDSNNQPMGEVLIDWTEINVPVDPGGLNKFEVSVSSNGTMRVFANNQQVVNDARDTTYLHDNHYFGVIVRTTENEPSRGRFDQYKITEGQ